jgi:membrane protein DedA with SNARE-associated domain
MMLRWALIVTALLAFILIPFALFDEPLSAWTLRLIRENPRGAFAIIAIALAADVFLPVPSSVVSTLAGTLLGFPQGLAASFAGMSAGSVLGYWFGATAGRAVIEKTVGSKDLDRVADLQQRFGGWSIVLSRPIPVLAEASVIAAGFTRMPFRRFLFLNALANLGISAAYAYTGATAADRDSFLLAFAGAIGIPALGLLLSQIYSRVRIKVG